MVDCSFNHKEPKDFFISQWQKNDRSLIYVIYRWIVAIFYIFCLSFTIYSAYNRHSLKFLFLYLTSWSLMVTTMSTISSAILATLYHIKLMKIPPKMTNLLKVHWFLSNTSISFAAFVTIIYWSVLHWFVLHPEVNFENVIKHITNSIVIMIDVFINKHPAKCYHFIWQTVISFFYAFTVTWLYFYLGGLNE